MISQCSIIAGEGDILNLAIGMYKPAIIDLYNNKPNKIISSLNGCYDYIPKNTKYRIDHSLIFAMGQRMLNTCLNKFSYNKQLQLGMNKSFADDKCLIQQWGYVWRIHVNGKRLFIKFPTSECKRKAHDDISRFLQVSKNDNGIGIRYNLDKYMSAKACLLDCRLDIFDNF